MVWSQIKQHCRRQAIYTNKPSKVLDLIHAVYSTKTPPKNWESIISITCHKGRRKFRKSDHIVDNEIEPVIIKYCSSSESDSDSNVEL